MKGFIALTSVLILSITLLVIAVGAGIGNFYTRMNMLEREFKMQSGEIAKSCRAHAQLALLVDVSYSGGETLSLQGGTCEISLITKNGSSHALYVSGVYKDAFTVFAITLDADSVITEEKEIPSIPA